MSGINRRSILKMIAAASATLPSNMEARAELAMPEPQPERSDKRPNVLFLMMDQMRYDCIAAHGNPDVYTPNLDRLVKRGVSFANNYSPCPVCVPARYCIRTGSLSPKTRFWSNGREKEIPAGMAPTVEGRCGAYLARTMTGLGYRTFGIGKFHSAPWNEDLGYQTHLHSEELYATASQRKHDSYAAWIAEKHPDVNWVDALMGERTEMYYMPQMSVERPEATVEGWAAARAVEQLGVKDEKPFFGFVSFIGPHPPFAPPEPFNRIYNPDKMPNPILGDLETDHMDEQIPWMNHVIWAENINNEWNRTLRARYYGEITYIDHCIGLILDGLDARGDADNTVICFFSDHGDHLGDHHAWQKESFFEASAHVPMLVSWPGHLPAGEKCEALSCLTDLFGIATGVAGKQELRDGADVCGFAAAGAKPVVRESLIVFYGEPATRRFKLMVRVGDWKYIWMANGGREQLFDLKMDPNEMKNLAKTDRVRRDTMYKLAVAGCREHKVTEVFAGEELAALPFEARKLGRIYQFDESRGVKGFAEKPEDVVGSFQWDKAEMV